VKFHFTISELIERHFSSLELKGKYKISKSREALTSPALLPTPSIEKVTQASGKATHLERFAIVVYSAWLRGVRFVELLYIQGEIAELLIMRQVAN